MFHEFFKIHSILTFTIHGCFHCHIMKYSENNIRNETYFEKTSRGSDYFVYLILNCELFLDDLNIRFMARFEFFHLNYEKIHFCYGSN